MACDGEPTTTPAQAEEAAEARCKQEARAAEAERTCEERCATADELVKKLEADLARDFAASKAVETCLDQRNLELKAEKRKSESLQAALDAAQKAEPATEDELRESLPRAAALQRELETVKKDAEEIAQHAAEQTRRREAAETAAQELKAEKDALRRTPTLRSCAAQGRRWPRDALVKRCRRSWPWRGRRATRRRRRQPRRA